MQWRETPAAHAARMLAAVAALGFARVETALAGEPEKKAAPLAGEPEKKAAPLAGEPEKKAAPLAGEPEKKVRGPAQDLVVEAGFGYGAAALTAIAGHDPKVAHGPALHAGLGWAFTLRSNQSVGLELFVDGMLDGERTTGDGRALGRRIGVAAFVIGERAHVRLGGGFSKTTFDKGEYDGLGVAFAAGWHFELIRGLETWKRPQLTVEFVPSWDFLSAGSETLHRPSFALVVGVAAY